MRASFPTTKTSSSSSFTTEAGSKPSSQEEIESYLSLSYNIMYDLNSFISQLIQRESINSATDELIHPTGSDLLDTLGKVKICNGESFLIYRLSILHRDDPYLGGEVKARGNTVFKKGNGDLHR